MSRNRTYISRDYYSIDEDSREPSWFLEYVKNLEKNAVKSKKDDYALFDQINNILGNKSKYSNVDEAVKDMARRTGLYDMLRQQKQAQLNNIFEEIPAMKIFIDNYVKDRPGTSVEAVIHDLLKINDIKNKLPEASDVPLEVKKYINDKILETNLNINKSMKEDLNLGKLDISVDDNTTTDNDPFSGCMPAVKK